MCAEDGEAVKGSQQQTAGSFHILMSLTVASHTEPVSYELPHRHLGVCEALVTERGRRMKTGTAGAMDGMSASSSNSCAEAFIPNVMGFGDGASGKWSGLDEVMRGPHDGNNILIKRGRDTKYLCLSLSLSFSLHAHTKESPCKVVLPFAESV